MVYLCSSSCHNSPTASAVLVITEALALQITERIPTAASVSRVLRATIVQKVRDQENAFSKKYFSQNLPCRPFIALLIISVDTNVCTQITTYCRYF